MPITLGKFMSGNVKTLNADQPLFDALMFLRQHGVRHVPILQDGQLVGVLTDRDVKRATPTALAPEQRPVWEKVVHGTKLSTVMTRDPLTGTADMPLRTAIKLIVDEKIGCIPIVEGEKLVGIVTARDLFKAVLTALG